jgi:signal transduction histidine kinase
MLFTSLKVIGWIFFAITSLTIFAVSQWEGYILHQTNCGPNINLCENFFQLTLDQVNELNELGLKPSFYSGVLNGLLGSQFLSFFIVSVILFYYGRKDSICYLASILLLCAGVDYSVDEATISLYPSLVPLFHFEQMIFGFTFFFFFMYPDEKFFPKWIMYPAILIFVLILSHYLFPGSILDAYSWPVWARGMHYILFNSLLIYSQIKRFKSYYSMEQKRRTIWFMVCIICFVTGALLAVLLHHALLKLLYLGLMYIAIMFLPFIIGLSLLERKMDNHSQIFSRSIVFILLIIFVIIAFSIITGTLGVIFQNNGNVMVSLITTALIAILFHPIQGKIQVAVNKLIYGEKEEPYAVLSHLVQRLEAVMSSQSTLNEIMESVAKALNLSYIAVLDDLEGDRPRIIASYGLKSNTISEIPLTIQGNWIATLQLGTLHLENTLPPTKRYLMEDLIRQVALAVQTTLTADELQRSRERLVTTREEERRRLRRDLHDGLGASLASISLQLDAVNYLMEKDIHQSKQLVSKIQSHLDQSISDIRTLVYALRPPELDEFGLMFALRQLIQQFNKSRMDITINGPDRITSLHAATEVAAYRIVQEALNNAVRHSKGTVCNVKVELVKDHLHIQIEDDGKGIPIEKTAGIGLRSMRERAEELGGKCSFYIPELGGAAISIVLPVGNINVLEGEVK